MLKVKNIYIRKTTRKILVALMGLCVLYVFSNTLVLTNQLNFYFNNRKALFNGLDSSGLLTMEFLKSHMDNALPMMRVVMKEDNDDVLDYRDVRWLTRIFTGFDIRDPKTILSRQILLMRSCDANVAAALVNTSESEILILPEKEPGAHKEKQEVDDVKSIRELISLDPHTREDEAENLESTAKITETTINPTDPKGYVFSDNIYVKNETDVQLNISKLLGEKLKMNISEQGPQVLIVHTHTSEAYTPTQENYYVPSDPDRTEDPRYNVVRVGEEIAKNLKNMGIHVIHDKTIHDYPSYSGSYRKTLQTIEAQLKKNPSISFVLDIHRDAFLFEDNRKLKVYAQVDGQKVAQVMFVVGTNQWGLEHPQWQENLKLALRLQQKFNRLYPKLARPINLRKERFNQHVTTGSLLLEVGSNGNTLEEAIRSSKYIARALAEVIKELE